MRRGILTAVAFLVLGSVAHAAPVKSVATIQGSGGQLRGVYAFGDAADTVQLNLVSPTAINNIFCNRTGFSCVESSTGQIFDLGTANSNLVFSINNLSKGTTFQTDQLASDGFSHALISGAVNARDSLAVAAAYALYNIGGLGADAAAAIASAALNEESLVTFIGWEDRVSGDFDYNDLVFAFVDSPEILPPSANDPVDEQPANGVPDPGLGLAGFLVFGFYALKRRKKVSSGS